MPKPRLTWLLAAVPVSPVARLGSYQQLTVFVSSAVAIIPLAGLIGRATDDRARRAGPRVGGLLNATFGNVTGDHRDLPDLHGRARRGEGFRRGLL